MSLVHTSQGRSSRRLPDLRSEVDIVCSIAGQARGRRPHPWSACRDDYHHPPLDRPRRARGRRTTRRPSQPAASCGPTRRATPAVPDRARPGDLLDQPDRGAAAADRRPAGEDDPLARPVQPPHLRPLRPLPASPTAAGWCHPDDSPPSASRRTTSRRRQRVEDDSQRDVPSFRLVAYDVPAAAARDDQGRPAGAPRAHRRGQQRPGVDGHVVRLSRSTQNTWFRLASDVDFLSPSSRGDEERSAHLSRTTCLTGSEKVLPPTSRPHACGSGASSTGNRSARADWATTNR